MSRLLLKGNSVVGFVASMPRQGISQSLIRYEETIRYAQFPMLHLSKLPVALTSTAQPCRSYFQHTNTEVVEMLSWLYDHSVNRIIALHVPDRIVHPHAELEIANVVKRFHVEELDWRILDLSLSIFQQYVQPSDIPLMHGTDNDRPKNDRINNVSTKSATTAIRPRVHRPR
ncbi:hypothetical protein SEUCBS139899_003273 [Sporothrix eucalyptigena]